MVQKVIEPLNIDEYLGKVKNRVALVSVELEGGWVTLPDGIYEVQRDGSVFNDRRPAGVTHVGELPIGPMLPAALSSQLVKHYPQKINKTCGMHVHMSFETLRYNAILMVPEYQETVLHYLSIWAKENGFKETHYIWPRLRGESEFCRKEFWPDVQSSTKRKDYDHNRPGHRYTAIHYCGRYNTVECRVLPMMNNPQLALSAINKLLDITNACIYMLGKKQKSDLIKSRLELPNGIIYEEVVEERISHD